MSGRSSFASLPTFRGQPERRLAWDARTVVAYGAVLATFASVLAIFAISPIALEARGITYIDAGGGFFAKFHPATPIAALAFVLRCLAARRPVQTAWRLLSGDSGVVLLLASVVVAAFFAATVDQTPVTPLADTFVLPVLLFILLRDLDSDATRWLALLVAVVLCCNAGLAILEFLKGFHAIEAPAPPGVTDDPTKANAIFSWKADLALDWRAEALLGHPLVNGLVVGSFLICLVAPASAWIPATIRITVAILQLLSLFCFGARTALVLACLLAAWLIVLQLADAIGRGARLDRRALAPLALGLCVVLAVAITVFLGGLADKTLDRFTNDNGSATTRLTMFALLTPMSLADLTLHPDKDLVATLQRVYGLEFGIESSWIGLTLTYGLIVAATVLAGVLAFWRSILRTIGQGGLSVFILYMTLISVTASLSGKTTSFAMVITLVLVFLRKDLFGVVTTSRSGKSRVHGAA